MARGKRIVNKIGSAINKLGKPMIWEGRFKNPFKNIHLLRNGAISASAGATPFYYQKELKTKKHHVTGSFNVIKEASNESAQQFGSGSDPYLNIVLKGSGTPKPK